MGKQVSETILNLINKGQLQLGLSDALMILLVKNDNPIKAAHFRPISLLNVVFKATIKALVNRLKPFLPNIVSPSQASFVPGRQIIDNVVIVQEVLHSMNIT